MNDFYYDLINITRKREDRLPDIEIIVNNCIKSFELETTSDGLCKVAANNISIDLEEKKIDYFIINTLDLGIDYEHVFIIALYKTTNLNYVLLDPTFSQFIPIENI